MEQLMDPQMETKTTGQLMNRKRCAHAEECEHERAGHRPAVLYGIARLKAVAKYSGYYWHRPSRLLRTRSMNYLWIIY